MIEEEKISKIESGNDDSLEPGELSGNSTPNTSPKAAMPSSSLEALRVSYKDDNDDNDSHQQSTLYSHPSNIGNHITFRGGFIPHFRGGPRGRGHLHWNRGGFNQGNKMIREQINENRIEHYRKSNPMQLIKKMNYTKTKPSLSWQVNTFYPKHKKEDTIIEKELSDISKTSSERVSHSLDRKSEHKNDRLLSKKNSPIKKSVLKIYKKHSRGKLKQEKESKYKERKFKKRSEKIKDKYKRKREKSKKLKKLKKIKESEAKCDLIESEEPNIEEESTTPPPKKSRIDQFESEKLNVENEKNSEDNHFTPEKKIIIEKKEFIEKQTTDESKVSHEFSGIKTPTENTQTPEKMKSNEKKTSGEKKTSTERKYTTPQNKEKVKKALQLDLRLSFVDELDYEEETLISDADVDAFPLTKDETVCAVDSKKQKKKLEKLENNITDDNSSSPDTDDYQDMWEEDVDMTINKETDIEFESKVENIQRSGVSKDLKLNRTDDEILNNLKLVKDQIKHELSITLDKTSLTEIPEESSTKKSANKGFKSEKKKLRNKKQKEKKSIETIYGSSSCENSSSHDSSYKEIQDITSEELRDGLGTPLFVNPSPPKDLILQSTPESTTPPLTPPIGNVKIERKPKKGNNKEKEQPFAVKPAQKYLFGMQDIYEQFIQSVNNDHGIDLSFDAKKSKENPKKISPIKPPRVDIFEEEESPKLIEKFNQKTEEKNLIPLIIPPATPNKLKPLVAPMIKTPVMKSITSPSSSETDSSSESEDSESDSSSTTVSDDEIFTREDKKKLRAFEKRLVTLTTWLASDEEEKKLFEGLQELIQNQIKLMKHKYADKLTANRGNPVFTALAGTKKPISEQQKEEQQKRHLEMIPRIIQPKIPAALQEIPMHLPSDKLLAQHKTASNKFAGIMLPSLAMSTMIFSIEKDFKDPKDYKELKETKNSGDTKFESKDSKDSRSSRDVKDNKENRHTRYKESKETKHSKDSKESKSKSSNIKSKTNKMDKHTDKRRISPKRSRSPQSKHKSTSRAPSPASSKKSSSSKGTSGRRSVSPKKNIKSLKKSHETRRKRRSRSRSPISKRVRAKRSENQTVRKPSAPPTPPTQRHRIVYSRSRSRSPLSPRNFKRRSLSPIADFRRSTSPQYRRSISPQYRRSNSPIFRKYSPSPERFRPPSPPSPETLQRDVSRSPSHYRSSPTYNRRFSSRSRSVSPEYQDHRHHIENITPVRWSASDEPSVQYYPEEYQYRFRQDSAYHAYNTQFNSYSDYMPTLGEESYSTYDYDQQTSGYSSSSSFEQNYYYNEYDLSAVYDSSLQPQQAESVQQISSNLCNIPVVTVENSTTVAVQKGNVLEIVPTNLPQTDEKKSELKVDEKKKRKISWKEEVDRRNVLSAILKLNRESEGGLLKSILIKANPEVSKMKEKKTVLFSDGIKPGSGSNDDKGGLIIKTEKKKRKKKSAEKPILQENKENVDAVDPELENAEPPPPPPGSPPPHLQQPVLKRPPSPDIILYFHFDPVVNSMYVSRNPNPIPPRLLAQKASNANSSLNKNQSGPSHIIPKKVENQNLMAPEKMGEKIFHPSRIPNRFTTPPPTHLMGPQIPIGPRISVATGTPIIPPMPIAAPMNFAGNQRFPRYPISGCNFSIPPPNNQFQKSFHIPVLTRIPTLTTIPYQHQNVVPKVESIPVYSSDSGGYYKKDNTTTAPSLPGPVQKFLRNEMKILSPIQPPSPSPSSSSSSPKISSSSSSSPRPASPKVPHTKILFDSNSAKISSLSKLVTPSHKLSDVVSKNGAQDSQELETIASVEAKKPELSEEKSDDNNKEIKLEVCKTSAESLEPVDV